MTPRKTLAPADQAAADFDASPAGKQSPRRLRRATEILAAAREAFLEKGVWKIGE